MNGMTGELRDQLKALRAQYRGSLLQKTDAIAQLLSQVQREAPRVEILREAHLRAHSLHGTAGSYELHAVGEAAGRLEEALFTLLQNVQDAQDAWTRVDAAGAELIAEAQLATAQAE